MPGAPETAAPAGRLLLFARNFLRHPRMLGSIVPSSRFLIRDLLEPVNWSRARVIVEYGPGVGVVTAAILGRMRADALLVAIEMNSDFVAYLRRTLPDARLEVVAGSAADAREILAARGLVRADYVISGIPLSILPAAERAQILERTRDLLAPGGALLVYQFSTKVLADLRRIFDYVGRRFQPLNVLPAHVFICQAAAA